MQTNQTNAGFIIRSEVWAEVIREEFKPWLFGQSHVMWITDFPDGTTHTIPTMQRIPVRDYVEGDEITTEDATLNEIQLTIDKYKQAGFNVTDKMKQDSYIIGGYIARAQVDVGLRLREQLEADVFNTVHTDTGQGHTIGDANNIDGQPHRWVAQGTSFALSYADFRQGKRVFDKHNVPYPRFAFLDPVAVEQLLAATDYSITPLAQNVYGANSFIQEGFSNNMMVGKFFGFILMMSNLLPTQTEETIGSDTASSGIVNLLMGPEAMYGAMRQNIEVETFRKPERKQDVYHASMRYGLRIFRDESIIAVISV